MGDKHGYYEEIVEQLFSLANKFIKSNNQDALTDFLTALAATSTFTLISLNSDPADALKGLDVFYDSCKNAITDYYEKGDRTFFSQKSALLSVPIILQSTRGNLLRADHFLLL